MKLIKIWQDPLKTDPRDWAWAIVWTEAGKEECDETLADGRCESPERCLSAAMKDWYNC
jgi:hypothetical protein